MSCVVSRTIRTLLTGRLTASRPLYATVAVVLAHLLTLYGGGRENVVLLPHGVLEEVKVGVALAAIVQSTTTAQMCCLSCVAQALRHPPWCTTFSTRACIHACIHVYP